MSRLWPLGNLNQKSQKMEIHDPRCSCVKCYDKRLAERAAAPTAPEWPEVGSTDWVDDCKRRVAEAYKLMKSAERRLGWRSYEATQLFDKWLIAKREYRAAKSSTGGDMARLPAKPR